MAHRDQPYLPLYVNDFLIDQKLNECSVCTVGVYIRMMCLMHKSKTYGTFLLEQNSKQALKQLPKHLPKDLLYVELDFCLRFASLFAPKFARQLPIPEETIREALVELLQHQVLHVWDDSILYQGRMVKDNRLTISRSENGRKGGEKTQADFAKAKKQANAKASTQATTSANPLANSQANTESENEYNNTLSSGNSNTVSTDKESIRVPIKGLGEFDISILSLGVAKTELMELKNFISKSEREFTVVAMNKPEMNTPENFRRVLQYFVTMVQEKGAYQPTNKLKDYFSNWLKNQNGKLNLIINPENKTNEKHTGNYGSVGRDNINDDF